MDEMNQGQQPQQPAGGMPEAKKGGKGALTIVIVIIILVIAAFLLWRYLPSNEGEVMENEEGTSAAPAVDVEAEVTL